jgi:hypothetical protein
MFAGQRRWIYKSLSFMTIIRSFKDSRLALYLERRELRHMVLKNLNNHVMCVSSKKPEEHDKSSVTAVQSIYSWTVKFTPSITTLPPFEINIMAQPCYRQRTIGTVLCAVQWGLWLPYLPYFSMSSNAVAPSKNKNATLVCYSVVCL